MTAAPRFEQQRSLEIAVRVECTCEWCGSPLAVKHRYSDGHRFVACSAYPACRFTCRYDEVIAALAAENLEQRAELEQLRRLAAVDWQRELRALIATAHPDRWMTSTAVEVATAITQRLLALREQLG